MQEERNEGETSSDDRFEDIDCSALRSAAGCPVSSEKDIETSEEETLSNAEVEKVLKQTIQPREEQLRTKLEKYINLSNKVQEAEIKKLEIEHGAALKSLKADLVTEHKKQTTQVDQCQRVIICEFENDMQRNRNTIENLRLEHQEELTQVH